jgi:hypothetical protein
VVHFVLLLGGVCERVIHGFTVITHRSHWQVCFVWRAAQPRSLCRFGSGGGGGGGGGGWFINAGRVSCRALCADLPPSGGAAEQWRAGGTPLASAGVRADTRRSEHSCWCEGNTSSPKPVCTRHCAPQGRRTRGSGSDRPRARWRRGERGGQRGLVVRTPAESRSPDGQG